MTTAALDREEVQPSEEIIASHPLILAFSLIVALTLCTGAVLLAALGGPGVRTNGYAGRGAMILPVILVMVMLNLFGRRRLRISQNRVTYQRRGYAEWQIDRRRISSFGLVSRPWFSGYFLDAEGKALLRVQLLVRPSTARSRIGNWGIEVQPQKSKPELSKQGSGAKKDESDFRNITLTKLVFIWVAVVAGILTAVCIWAGIGAVAEMNSYKTANVCKTMPAAPTTGCRLVTEDEVTSVSSKPSDYWQQFKVSPLPALSDARVTIQSQGFSPVTSGQMAQIEVFEGQVTKVNGTDTHWLTVSQSNQAWGFIAGFILLLIFAVFLLLAKPWRRLDPQVVTII